MIFRYIIDIIDNSRDLQSVDVNPSLGFKGFFLDFSKAFDRVGHDGLMYNLKYLGISKLLRADTFILK